MQESDAELVGSISRGDIVAFERLYDRYASVVLAVAERLSSDREAAADALIGAFVELRSECATPLGRPGPKPVLRWLVERVVALSAKLSYEP